MIPVYNMLVSLWREVSDCEELVGVTWRVSDCEELSGGGQSHN